MEYYFIRMAAAADHTVPHSIGPIFMLFFRNYDVVSRQWHYECWPSNAELSLVCL